MLLWSCRGQHRHLGFLCSSMVGMDPRSPGAHRTKRQHRGPSSPVFRDLRTVLGECFHKSEQQHGIPVFVPPPLAKVPWGGFHPKHSLSISPEANSIPFLAELDPSHPFLPQPGAPSSSQNVALRPSRELRTQRCHSQQLCQGLERLWLQQEQTGMCDSKHTSGKGGMCCRDERTFQNKESCFWLGILQQGSPWHSR